MKLKQLLISTASIAALAVVPMSIVSCGNNNNNSVDQLPPSNGGDSSTPGTGDSSTPGTGDGDTQEPAIKYIDVKDKNEMVKHILTDPYIVSEFIRQIFNRPVDGKVTFVNWTNKLTSIVPGAVEYNQDKNYYYYNITNITFYFEAGAPVLYYSVNNETLRHTVSGNGSRTISTNLHFRSTTKFTNTGN